MRITLTIIALFFTIVLIFYGTLSPCEILKKEIANEARKSGEQASYLLVGGFINRGIDTFGPAQCLGGLYKVKVEGVDSGLEDLFDY